jgi:hypothetical protein
LLNTSTAVAVGVCHGRSAVDPHRVLVDHGHAGRTGELFGQQRERVRSRMSVCQLSPATSGFS